MWPAAAGFVATALLVTLPWRLCFTSRSIGGDGPEEGGLGVQMLEQAKGISPTGRARFSPRLERP